MQLAIAFSFTMIFLVSNINQGSFGVQDLQFPSYLSKDLPQISHKYKEHVRTNMR